MEDAIIPFALLCFTSFFTLTNPLGTMPVFLTMTNGMDEKERKHIVKRATIISFIILIAFTFCGQFLFKFFGISTNGFRIAAGIIIMKIGYDTPIPSCAMRKSRLMPMTFLLLRFLSRCCVVQELLPTVLSLWTTLTLGH